jgi:dolichol kinase
LEFGSSQIERLLTGQIVLGPISRALIRAAVHIAVGLVSVIGLWLLPRVIVIVALATLAIIFLSFDVARLRIPALNVWFSKWFALFLRQDEADRLTGASYFLLGCLLTVLVFPREIASLAILFVSLGDPAAKLIGIWKGRPRLWGKSLEGSLACLIACLVVGILVTSIAGEPVLVVAIVGAVLATLFELLPLSLNDNITIPFGSAAVMVIIGLLV